MRIHLKRLFGMVLLVTLIAFVPASADAGNSGSDPATLTTSATTSQNTTSSSSSSSNNQSGTDDGASGSTLQQRLTEHEGELKLKLTTAQQQHLVLKCLPAQATIKILGDKVNANVPQRVNAYQELSNRLTALIAKLKAAGLDTAQLEAASGILTTKISTFNTDLATYKQDLSDLQAVNCKQDPTGFQAALDAARAQRDTLTADIQDIATYVTGTIKPTLATLRAQLEAKESTGGTH